MLVKRFANDLHDALELRSRGLVPHVGLIGLPPFLGELAEQARSLGATLLLVAVLSRIRPLRQQPQGVNRLVLGLGELQAGRLGRTKAHLLDNAVALVTERPATATAWRDDQIKVVAARVFAGANGEIVFCGNLGFFRSKLHAGFELPTHVVATTGNGR